MKLLLHTCCAPCAIQPIEEAQKDGFIVTGFFYNPNIQPHSEYKKREKEAFEYFRDIGVEFIQDGYDTRDYFKNISGEEDAKSRCPKCWRMRIDRTASYAGKNGFRAFTTTLLVSPHQKHDALKRICEEFSGNSGLHFYYRDFRDGFRTSHKKAREKGMYCQNYCGCAFSLVEREEKRRDG